MTKKYKIKYEYITNPDELSCYMAFNIEYRWMNKNGELQDNIVPEMYTDYSLMSPEEVIKNNAGICVDQVELERDWFEENNYNYEVLCIEIICEDSSPGHVFLIYYSENEWCWFENAWGDYKGIHRYSSRESLIEDITNKFIEQNNILKEELANLYIKTFPKYPYHYSYEQMEEYDKAISK